MNKKIYFNWEELQKLSNKDVDAILILTFASLLGYNKILSWGAKNLRNRLFINYIPQFLFRKKLIYLSRDNKIISKYECREPLSYFLNSQFIYYKCPIRIKINYLYILSQRNINNNNSYIPKNYVESEYLKNPLITLENENIIFPYETLTKE